LTTFYLAVLILHSPTIHRTAKDFARRTIARRRKGNGRDRYIMLVNSNAPSSNPITIDGKKAARYAKANLNTLYGHMRTVQREL
jgi:hypothetical protein